MFLSSIVEQEYLLMETRFGEELGAGF
jgi:hypothetical protein